LIAAIIAIILLRDTPLFDAAMKRFLLLFHMPPRLFTATPPASARDARRALPHCFRFDAIDIAAALYFSLLMLR